MPLGAAEGFIRQIPGWREFRRHLYDECRSLFATTNALESQLPQPAWSRRTISDMSGLPSPHQARSQTQRRPGCFSGEAVIGQAHTLKVRALVKLGELLEDLPKDKGGFAVVPRRYHGKPDS